MRGLRLQKRMRPTTARRALVTACAVVMALVLGGLVIALVGVSPIAAYAALFRGGLGSGYGLSETMVKAIPLIFCALSVSVALRMRLWNVGAEGQYVVGALASSLVALGVSGLGRGSYFALMFAAAFAAGAVWGAIPGILRARLNVSEIITTLLMNWVAIYLIQFFVYGPLRGADGFPFTRQFPPDACLVQLGWGRLHAGIVMALCAALILSFLLRRTVWGYEVKVIGDSPECARYAGMSIAGKVVMVMALSGGLAGLGGFCQVAGIECRIPREVFASYGYTAIIIAWLARADPLGAVLVSIIFGGLLTGGELIQISMGVPISVVHILTGSILVFLLAGELFIDYQITWGRQPSREGHGHVD
jgi:simple sugar transport system permease protein